jgi:MFS family permease
MVAGALIAAGFADFSLIAFHFQKSATISADVVPVFYAAAMATGAVSSPLLGRLLDKLGRAVVLVAFFLPALFAPFVFFGNAQLAFLGMVLWGLGMGAEDTILKALLVDVIPAAKRSTAFGIFDTAFGVAWFLGSAVMGFLYDRSIIALVIFSVVTQLAALPMFFLASRR